jgi:hypothetical protein
MRCASVRSLVCGLCVHGFTVRSAELACITHAVDCGPGCSFRKGTK